MTAECVIDGEPLINPYISLEFVPKGGDRAGVGINTHHFGPCQRYLIHPINDQRRQELREGKVILYEAHAVVTEYNNPLEDPMGLPEIFPRTVSIARNERGRIFLGWLEESVVREHLSRAHEEIQESIGIRKPDQSN